MSVFVFSHLKIFQTSALHLPVMPEVRCAVRTKKATTFVTVSQAGPEPDVRKVLSSLWKVREVMGIVGHGVLELRRGQVFALSFTLWQIICHIQWLWIDVICNVTLVLTFPSIDRPMKVMGSQIFLIFSLFHHVNVKRCLTFQNCTYSILLQLLLLTCFFTIQLLSLLLLLNDVCQVNKNCMYGNPQRESVCLFRGQS